MTPGLTDFLQDRLGEDEAAAKAAWPGPWDLETEVGGFGPVAYVLMPLPHKGARTGLTRYIPLGTQDADTAAHIARHDPARVLREVKAKRAILRAEMDRALGGVVGYSSVLLSLASIYSDHEGYRDEWRP